jgi:hypothetical protein
MEEFMTLPKYVKNEFTFKSLYLKILCEGWRL